MNGSRWVVAASMAFLATPIILGTGASGASQARMHDHSQHGQPAPRSRASGISPPRQAAANPSAGAAATHQPKPERAGVTQ